MYTIITAPPTTEVGGVKLTWDKGNSVLVEWDHVTDDITGYKLHWSGQSNKSISTPDAVLTATNNTTTQFLIEHSNEELMNAIILYVYIWTYNLAGDGPVTNSSKF